MVEVEAEGYFPIRVTNSVTSSPEMAMNVEIKKASKLAGLVRSPEGEPVQGATVASAQNGWRLSSDSQVQFKSIRPSIFRPRQQTRMDASLFQGKLKNAALLWLTSWGLLKSPWRVC